VVKPALTVELPGGVPMTFQRVPTDGEPQPFRMGERGLGSVLLGSSDPVVRVQVTQAFYLGTYPVTQAHFAVWTRA
jgi:formylglycine-generating enzyme required for sulfatase activity